MKNNNNNNNNFLKDIINNKFYNRYKLLLNNNKDSSEIQKDIERYVSESWKNEFLNLLKNKDELLKGKHGYNLLGYTIDNLEKLIDEYKNSHLVKNTSIYSVINKVSSDIILSSVLCRVIPFIYSESDLNENNVYKLYPKIGKDIYSSLFIIEYENYINWYKKQDKSKNNKLN